MDTAKKIVLLVLVFFLVFLFTGLIYFKRENTVSTASQMIMQFRSDHPDFSVSLTNGRVLKNYLKENNLFGENKIALLDAAGMATDKVIIKKLIINFVSVPQKTDPLYVSGNTLVESFSQKPEQSKKEMILDIFIASQEFKRTPTDQKQTLVEAAVLRKLEYLDKLAFLTDDKRKEAFTSRNKTIASFSQKGEHFLEIMDR